MDGLLNGGRSPMEEGGRKRAGVDFDRGRFVQMKRNNEVARSRSHGGSRLHDEGCLSAAAKFTVPALKRRHARKEIDASGGARIDEGDGNFLGAVT